MTEIDSLNFVTQFIPKRACEGGPTTSHGDMEECPRCQVRVDREMVHHPVFGFASMCGLKTSTAPPCTACGLREKVARLEFALAQLRTTPEAHEKAVAVANNLAQWLNANRIPPQELHPAYNAWVLLCDFIAKEAL
jgi:hypothetical protein